MSACFFFSLDCISAQSAARVSLDIAVLASNCSDIITAASTTLAAIADELPELYMDLALPVRTRASSNCLERQKNIDNNSCAQIVFVHRAYTSTTCTCTSHLYTSFTVARLAHSNESMRSPCWCTPIIVTYPTSERQPCRRSASNRRRHSGQTIPSCNNVLLEQSSLSSVAKKLFLLVAIRKCVAECGKLLELYSDLRQG